MAVELNHTVIAATDKWRSAKFLAGILGLEAGPEWSHFVPVRTSNGVTLDFADAAEFRRAHYAFLVSEQEFDAALSRINEADVAFYADFNRDGRGKINHLYGGRSRSGAKSGRSATCSSVGPHSSTCTRSNPKRTSMLRYVAMVRCCLMTSLVSQSVIRGPSSR